MQLVLLKDVNADPPGIAAKVEASPCFSSGYLNDCNCILIFKLEYWLLMPINFVKIFKFCVMDSFIGFNYIACLDYQKEKTSMDNFAIKITVNSVDFV